MRNIAEEINSIYLFIAELHGYRVGTEAGKLAFGRECYLTTRLLDLDYNKESDRSDMHENIWLQRLYDDLDNCFGITDSPLAGIYKTRSLKGKERIEDCANPNYKWSVPIELDAGASMLQYIGILLGDETLCTRTNLVGTELQDPWAFGCISRAMFKHAATPRLYGSSRACYELWNDWKDDYTLEQVVAFNTELTSGLLSVADAFKEFIINNVKPTEQMRVRIWNEEFDIECNRFRNVGEETLRYDIFDTETRSIRRICHTRTKKVPDLQQFRRYFVTLLIHNLDSQVADSVVAKVMEKYGWCIDIHDAFVVSPEAANDVRTWYAEALTEIYNNRETILSNYFASIGIGSEAQGNWERVKRMVKPLQSFQCRKMALK